jgi:heme A synthase
LLSRDIDLRLLQIALGGVVRVTGSDGCPTTAAVPRTATRPQTGSIIQYSHRAVGLTELLIRATFFGAWMVWRNRRPVVAWLASAALVAESIGGAPGRGGRHEQLASWLVLIHLARDDHPRHLVATVVMSMPSSTGIPDPGFRRLAALAAGATYLLLLTGSSVVASGADASCRSWPMCGSGLTPDFTGVNSFTMLHRGSVLVIGALLVVVLLRAARFAGLRVVAIATLAVFALQVAVGAGAAVTDASLFNGVHVALATLVWAGTLATAMLALPRADRDAQPSRMIVQKGPA